MHFCIADLPNTSTDFVPSRVINPLAVPTTSSSKHDEHNQVSQNFGNGVLTNNHGEIGEIENSESDEKFNDEKAFPLIGLAIKSELLEFDSDASEEPVDDEEGHVSAANLMALNIADTGNKCSLCPSNEKKFERVGFISHLRFHHFVCHICGTKFQTYQLLMNHSSKMHSKKNPNTTNQTVNKMYRAKRKYKKRTKRADIKPKLETQNTASTSKVFNCFLCHLTFTTQSDIEAHMLWRHNITTIQPDQTETYNCCLQTFSSRKKFKKHQRSAEHQYSQNAKIKSEAVAVSVKKSSDPLLTNPRVCIKRMYKCPDCSFTTKSAKGCKIHQAVIHSKENRGLDKKLKKAKKNLTQHGLECEYCGFIGSSLGFLQLHKRKKHADAIKNIQGVRCSICLKIFTNEGYLKRHMYKKHDPKEKRPKEMPVLDGMTREWMDNGPGLDINIE